MKALSTIVLVPVTLAITLVARVGGTSGHFRSAFEDLGDQTQAPSLNGRCLLIRERRDVPLSLDILAPRHFPVLIQRCE